MPHPVHFHIPLDNISKAIGCNASPARIAVASSNAYGRKVFLFGYRNHPWLVNHHESGCMYGYIQSPGLQAFGSRSGLEKAHELQSTIPDASLLPPASELKRIASCKREGFTSVSAVHPAGPG